jgi:hypothetical protein
MRQHSVGCKFSHKSGIIADRRLSNPPGICDKTKNEELLCAGFYSSLPLEVADDFFVKSPKWTMAMRLIGTAFSSHIVNQTAHPCL